jgi:hypothetical protein
VLVEALGLVSNPEKLYAEGNDAIRRNVNQAFYQCFYLDDDGVQADRMNPPFEDSMQPSRIREARKPAAARSLKLSTTKRGPSREPRIEHRLIVLHLDSLLPLPTSFRTPVRVRPLWWS